VVAGCVRMPPHEMRTTRHQPEDFMIVFEQPHQRTLALRVGAVRVKGVTFNVIPWYEHIHGGMSHGGTTLGLPLRTSRRMPGTWERSSRCWGSLASSTRSTG
jgi:hypothetical protein